MESFVLFRLAIISFIMKELCPLVDITCAFVHVASSIFSGGPSTPIFPFARTDLHAHLCGIKGASIFWIPAGETGKGKTGELTASNSRKNRPYPAHDPGTYPTRACSTMAAGGRSSFGGRQCDWRIRAMYNVTPFSEWGLASFMQIALDSNTRNRCCAAL
jgi:hypothetical protein